jgi:hypothetical protein
MYITEVPAEWTPLERGTEHQAEAKNDKSHVPVEKHSQGKLQEKGVTEGRRIHTPTYNMHLWTPNGSRPGDSKEWHKNHIGQGGTTPEKHDLQDTLRKSSLVSSYAYADASAFDAESSHQSERILAQGDGNLTMGNPVLTTSPICSQSAQQESLEGDRLWTTCKIDEWFVQSKIPLALKAVLDEEGYDTEETFTELTEDTLQSLCERAGVKFTQGLKIKFRKLSERIALTASMTASRVASRLRMQAAAGEIKELHTLHSQGFVTDQELEVNRRLILTKYGIAHEPDGAGSSASAAGPISGVARSILTGDTPRPEPSLPPAALVKQPLEQPNCVGCLVVVVDNDNHRLQVVNPIDGSFVRSIGNGEGSGANQFSTPFGVTTLPNGHVLVGDTFNHRIQVVNPIDGTFVRSIGNGEGGGPNQFRYPTGVTTLPNGLVVVADTDNHRLQVVNPIDGLFVRSIGHGEGSGAKQFSHPRGVTALPNGYVVVVDRFNHRLQVVNPSDGSFVRTIGNGFGSGPNQFFYPTGVTSLPNGLLVVADRDNHRLQVVNSSDGSFVRSIGNGLGSGPNQLSHPRGLTALPNGHVVVVDQTNHRLQVVNPIDGSFVRSIGNGEGSGPDQFYNPTGITTLPGR